MFATYYQRIIHFRHWAYISYLKSLVEGNFTTTQYRKQYKFFCGWYCSLKQHKVGYCNIAAIKDLRHFISQMSFKMNMIHSLFFFLCVFVLLWCFNFLWGEGEGRGFAYKYVRVHVCSEIITPSDVRF